MQPCLPGFQPGGEQGEPVGFIGQRVGAQAKVGQGRDGFYPVFADS
jgi:hypothetical protein